MEEHISKLEALVAKERQCEIEQSTTILNTYSPKQLQGLGLALLNLRVSGMRTGMGGKSLVDLETAIGGMDLLPTHKFRTGDIVGIEKGDRAIKDAGGKNEAALVQVSGVVTRVTDQVVTVALKDELPSELEMGCRL
jgi:DNA polymerase alpha-associated DNA helicase A